MMCLPNSNDALYPLCRGEKSFMDYDDYLNYQEDIRGKFKGFPLLDVEFKLWLGQPVV